MRALYIVHRVYVWCECIFHSVLAGVTGTTVSTRHMNHSINYPSMSSANIWLCTGHIFNIYYTYVHIYINETLLFTGPLLDRWVAIVSHVVCVCVLPRPDHPAISYYTYTQPTTHPFILLQCMYMCASIWEFMITGCNDSRHTLSMYYILCIHSRLLCLCASWMLVHCTTDVN